MQRTANTLAKATGKMIKYCRNVILTEVLENNSLGTGIRFAIKKSMFTT